MIATLRERRRQQTAREIQQAALRLSLRIGYPAVTIDLIAAEAGVSPRTFFNYYPNKQAAILGEVPQLDCKRINWTITPDGSLSADLASLVGSLLAQKQLDRNVVCMIEQVCDNTAELAATFRNTMDNVAVVIGEQLELQLGPEHRLEARLLAQLTASTLSHSVRAWSVDDTMTVDDIVQMVEQSLARMGQLLR
ncbi:MAG: TetR/AcrR family transcriptional regulator [Paracoccus sp. (in: a-proteobacteria)]